MKNSATKDTWKISQNQETSRNGDSCGTRIFHKQVLCLCGHVKHSSVTVHSIKGNELGKKTLYLVWVMAPAVAEVPYRGRGIPPETQTTSCLSCFWSPSHTGNVNEKNSFPPHFDQSITLWPSSYNTKFKGELGKQHFNRMWGKLLRTVTLDFSFGSPLAFILNSEKLLT